MATSSSALSSVSAPLGVVTRVTLDLLPTFQVAQSVYQNLSFDHLEHNFDDIFGSGYSVSLFTDWQNHRPPRSGSSAASSPATRTIGRRFFGAKLATGKLHPIAGHSAETAPSSRESPAPGTSACRTSA